MQISLENLSPTQIYHLMTQTVIPRPIAWVLTENNPEQKQAYNLAPFSYFTAVSSNPPLLMISAGQKLPGINKDTVVNSQVGAKAVIHIASQEQYKEVTQSAATFDYGESELSQTDMQTTPMADFDLPRLIDCPIAFACSVFEVQKMGNAPQTLVFYQIEQVYVDDRFVTTDNNRVTVDALKLQPLNRLGAAQYGTLGEIIEQQRPK